MKRKNAPGAVPRCATYERIARTGDKSSPVSPSHTSTPLPNWSVFDLLRNTRILEGGELASVLTSPHARWTAGSKAVAVGTVISPALKNPKKHVTAAAHTMVASKVTGGTNSTPRIRCNKGGVIGRRSDWGGPRATLSLQTLVWISCSRGSDDVSLRSGNPLSIWAFRIAAKYVFIVAGASPSFAIATTK